MLVKGWLRLDCREGISFAEKDGFMRASCAGKVAAWVGIAGFGRFVRSGRKAEGLVRIDAVGEPGWSVDWEGVEGMRFEVESAECEDPVYRSILGLD